MILKQYVYTVAQAMGTDPVCVALASLTTCAAAIGTSRSIKLKNQWCECPLLWSMIIAEQGSGKSPPMREAVKPLFTRQRREFDAYVQACQQYEAELTAYQRDVKQYQTRKNIKMPVSPKEPTCVRHVVSDATLEALAPILLENPRGLLLDGDELAGWFGSMDRYVQTKQGDAAAWRRIFDGHDITIDRKTNRQCIYVPNPSVSIIGTIQPKILQKILGVEHQESGLAARWLMAMPPKHASAWSDADISPQIVSSYTQLIDDLLALKPCSDRHGKMTPQAISMTGQAKKRFVQWYDQHRAEQTYLPGVLSGHWSKLVAYCARFALIIQTIRDQSEQASSDQIDEISMQSAIVLTNWHKTEAKRVYAMLSENKEAQQRRSYIEIIKCRGGKMSIRDWQRARSHPTAKAAEKELGEFIAANIGQWESLAPSVKGGRPTKCFLLNN